MPQRPTIGLFTVVKNRLHHLRQTLPSNFTDNSDPDTTWLVLDYDSSDGLSDYISDNFSNELKAGRMLYRRFSPAKYFSHAHSRNLAVQQLNTDYVCNIDADNFTGPGFDQYLQGVFGRLPVAVVTGLSNHLKCYGAFGRMAVSRKLFLEVGGYDESFMGYGFEDYDLVSRLEEKGLPVVKIDDPEFLQVLPHGNADRTANEWTQHQLHTLYRQQVNDELQVLLYLFKDQTFHYGVVHEDFEAGTHYRYTLAGNAWQYGKWSEQDHTLQLNFPEFAASFEKTGEYIIGNNHQLKQETRPDEFEEAVLFHTNMGNSCRYRQNKHNKIIRVNEQGFGQGTTLQLLT